MGTAIGRLTVTQLAARVPKRNRMRMRTGYDHGLKGDRHYDRATLGIHPDGTPDDQAGGHCLGLVRRHRRTREPDFCRCRFATPPTWRRTSRSPKGVVGCRSSPEVIESV
ncbi:hypothetical protein [Streptomyces sp. CA-111067]|uniref:hypothetical protein n=1 Tax=Streptomyces sp. CA-111067 TaxID=3240046 RepID=UPI003D951C31